MYPNFSYLECYLLVCQLFCSFLYAKADSYNKLSATNLFIRPIRT